MFGQQDNAAPSGTDQPAAPAADNGTDAPYTGVDSTQAPATDVTPSQEDTASQPEPSLPEPQSTDAGSDAVAPLLDQAGSGNMDDLLNLKQQALQQLAPLVEHLDQNAEEKFRTTMMMIQATDNQALLQQAYDAANAIQDEKAKAQALLDVINEINYFSQQHEDHHEEN